MGGAIARACRDHGYTVAVHDVDAAAVERVRGPGIEAAGSLGRMATSADVVLLSLPLPVHVEAVVAGDQGLLSALRAGAVIVDLSTVDPETTRRMEARARAGHVGYLDAPVLGRPTACGRWTLPVGGAPSHLALAEPVLRCVAATVTHVGPPGAGNTLKLLNNLMLGAINAVTAEVMAACGPAGLDPATFVATVSSSGAASVSNLFLEIGPKIVAGDFSPAFTLDLLHKDNGLALTMLEHAGVPAVIGSAVQLLNGMARSTGYGNQDTSALVEVYRRLGADAARFPEPRTPRDQP